MTPQECKAIRDRCRGMSGGLVGPHPLDGLSVREWVTEARAGWPKAPKAPTPKQARERALRLAAKHDVGFADT